MFQQIVQQAVNLLIVVMASILFCFTLLLVVLHFVTNATQERMQRIRKQILRLLNSNEQIEFMKEQVYRVIDSSKESVTLEGIRGIRTKRGIQVLELVSRELNECQKTILRGAVSNEWYAPYLQKAMDGWNKETAILAVKLMGLLCITGYTASIENNFKRWPKDASVQEIGLLTLFIQGNKSCLIRLFSDEQFHVLLSFRSLHELFGNYGGNAAELYRELLSCAPDQYVKRACIRGIGDKEYQEFGAALLPELTGGSINVLLETIRTMGKLKYMPACEEIRTLTRHEMWEVRCAAVDALFCLDKENCSDDILACLYDQVWWVRFHAAEVLAELSECDKLLADVCAGTDQYAREMLEYVIERNEILKVGVAVS